jgi:hypothetical protein
MVEKFCFGRGAYIILHAQQRISRTTDTCSTMCHEGRVPVPKDLSRCLGARLAHRKAACTPDALVIDRYPSQQGRYWKLAVDSSAQGRARPQLNDNPQIWDIVTATKNGTRKISDCSGRSFLISHSSLANPVRLHQRDS